MNIIEAKGLLINHTDTPCVKGKKIWVDFQVGGNSKFSVDAIGNIVVSQDAEDEIRMAAKLVSRYIQKHLKGHSLV